MPTVVEVGPGSFFQSNQFELGELGLLIPQTAIPQRSASSIRSLNALTYGVRDSWACVDPRERPPSLRTSRHTLPYLVLVCDTCPHPLIPATPCMQWCRSPVMACPIPRTCMPSDQALACLVIMSTGSSLPGILYTRMMMPSFTFSCKHSGFTGQCLTLRGPRRVAIPSAALTSVCMSIPTTIPMSFINDCIPKGSDAPCAIL